MQKDKTLSAKTDITAARPLSPHIQIYRWTLTMLLSILHRATGIVLYAGMLVITGWLLAVAGGEQSYAYTQAVFRAWYGQCLLFAYAWACFHHIFGGLRHFLWDIGYGFQANVIEIFARLALVLPFVLAFFTWMLARHFMMTL